ncbi:MAG: antitoxin Xre/MbcA/ParS toxin-binding domain-containing protein [Elusimicrobiota bacterium]
MKTNDFIQHEPLTAENVSDHLITLMKIMDLPAQTIAQGVDVSELQLNRIIKKHHKPRQETVKIFNRIEKVFEEATQAMTEKGAVKWLKTPNPYLNDVAPIKCLRSDKELEKVISLLSAMKYGFPA